jgi:two-component system LytT family response regulator
MIRALIVDDEPLARSALETILTKRHDVEAFDTANDAVQALEKLKESAFDVLLLDISMPELSGMEMVDAIKKMKKPLPSVVFVTAHNEHAIAAFERHAVDYVLKPFSEDRIHNALDVAIRRTQGERAARLMGSMPQLQQPAKRNRIAIKAKGRILFIDPSEIVSVQAEGNYVLFQRESGSYLLRETISTVAEKMKPFGFIRIHRSVLVNTAFVAEIHPWFTGEYVMKMRNGKEFSVSRTFKQNLAALAEFWIGAEGFVD